MWFKILYRPFDVRHTYYTGRSTGIHVVGPVQDVMRHMLAGENLSLCVNTCQGQVVGAGERGNLICLFTESITEDLNLCFHRGLESVDMLIPLYLYPYRQTASDLFRTTRTNRATSEPGFEPDFGIGRSSWQ